MESDTRPKQNGGKLFLPQYSKGEPRIGVHMNKAALSY